MAERKIDNSEWNEHFRVERNYTKRRMFPNLGHANADVNIRGICQYFIRNLATFRFLFVCLAEWNWKREWAIANGAEEW